MHHVRTIIAALLVAAAVVAARSAVVSGASTALGAGQHEQPAASAPPHSAPGQGSVLAQESEQGTEPHDSGWLAVIAKAFNFAILVGILVYFLKTPLIDYLNGRIVRVREDLVAAAETRKLATDRLAQIHEQLAALPGEIEALKKRGTEEIAAERVRIEEAAETERQRVLEHMHREIDMRLRIARRDLIEHASTLAVEVASARIRAAITADDQARLFDRYTAQIGGPGQGPQETRT
jgi:F-type H+-transporting ATPase subunit b